MSKTIEITLDHWTRDCADGCCTDYGTKIFIDGKEIPHDYSVCDDSVLGSVLRYLGYDATITERCGDEN